MGAGAGSTGACSSVSGTDGNFRITFTTSGTAPTTAGVVFTITYSATRNHTSYGSAYIGTTSIANLAIINTSSSTTSATFSTPNGTALLNSSTYTYNVILP
jgi:hypothetical protein